MSYKEFLNIGSKTIRDKRFNIDKLVNDVEAIKRKKVDTAIIKLSINKDKMLEDLAKMEDKVLSGTIETSVILAKWNKHRVSEEPWKI